MANLIVITVCEKNVSVDLQNLIVSVVEFGWFGTFESACSKREHSHALSDILLCVLGLQKQNSVLGETMTLPRGRCVSCFFGVPLVGWIRRV